jgi:hypothetical protein
MGMTFLSPFMEHIELESNNVSTAGFATLAFIQPVPFLIGTPRLTAKGEIR